MTQRLPPALLEAYRKTSYRVLNCAPPISLKIDEHNEALRTLHETLGVSSSVFITAFNPFGADLPEHSNAQAMAKLTALMDRRGIPYLPGVGCGDDGVWPPEPSVLAFGVDVRRSRALCRLFRQNAAVHCGHDAIPRLLLHPHARSE